MMRFGCSRVLSLAACMVAIFAVSASAQQALDLQSVAPTSGSFQGGTPIELTGDFSVTFNTGPALAQYQVYFTQSGTANPATDLLAVVTASDVSSVKAITPTVQAPGSFNVYVRATNAVESHVSNLKPFEFTNSAETPAQAQARAILDSFSFADGNNDGLIDLQEAQRVLPGITQAEFDALDADQDGFLSAEELNKQDGRGDSCQDQIGQFLTNFPLFGIFAFLLSLLGSVRDLLFGLFIPRS